MTRLINLILPGTDVPSYRLLRPYGTVSVAVLNTLAQPEQIAPPPFRVMFFLGGRMCSLPSILLVSRTIEGTTPLSTVAPHIAGTPGTNHRKNNTESCVSNYLSTNNSHLRMRTTPVPATILREQRHKPLPSASPLVSLVSSLGPS
ncbi:MAG: hypothetical protein QOE55_3818, partial [Acidobacteriaceae bacterium]|nr:hypothetical protein [Acidobacteriaceae bacterium]